MKKETERPLLADMHYDGVHFDPRIREALRSQRARTKKPGTDGNGGTEI